MKKPKMNNKQRVYVMALFLIWFAIGNICRHTLHYPMPLTLLINSFIVPLCMAFPCFLLYDYLGGKKMPFLSAPN